MIKSVIVEDNQVALKVLKRMIDNNFPEIEIVGTATNVDDAVVLIKDKRPDLLFLDIELPDGNAFNILDYLEDNNFRVVFVTSHENYAIKAIKLSALDYLVKPVTRKDLTDAIIRYKESYNNNENNILNRNVFKDNIQDVKKQSKILINTTKEHIVVNIEDIVRCMSDSYYTHVFLNNKERHMVSKTLKDYESLLFDFGFIRVHHQHLININYIKSLSKEDKDMLVLTEGTKIPVSRRRKNIVTDFFKNDTFFE